MNSENDGIYSFNPQTEKFVNYRNDPRNANSLADDLTQGLTIDKNGNVWIATQSGLDKFEPSTNRFTHYTHQHNDSGSISNNQIFAICADEEDNLWLATGSPGIDYFNSHTGKLLAVINQRKPSLSWRILYTLLSESPCCVVIFSNAGKGNDLSCAIQSVAIPIHKQAIKMKLEAG